ncbi:hypothetical protein ACUSIJ_17775 [Pseudochelatococcus sp. B33]
MPDAAEVAVLTEKVIDIVSEADASTALSCLLNALLAVNNAVADSPAEERRIAAQLAETIIEGAQLYSTGVFDREQTH